jgi:hypothetical protein
MPSTLGEHQVHLSDGRFDGTTADELRAAIAGAGDTLYVYFHGGLVARAAGTAAAEALAEVWKPTGATGLFVVWHSGFGEVLRSNLAEIGKDLLFVRLRDQLSRFVLAKIEEIAGGRAPGQLELPAVQGAAERLAVAPAAPPPPLLDEQVDQLERTLRKDLQLGAAVEGIVAAESGSRAPGAVDAGRLVSPEFRTRIVAESAAEGNRSFATWAVVVKAAVSVLRRVVERLRDGRDHGAYVTLVEELLREVYLDAVAGSFWSAIKKDTADAFADGADRGGGVLLDAIMAWWKPGRRVVLLGHSTGAVYILELLEAFAKRFPNAPADLRFDVVWLAGAATFARWKAAWPAWSARVRRFLSVGLGDERERADHLGGPVFPASLLYFVAGVAEDEVDAPLVGMERGWTSAKLAGEPGVAEAIAWVRDTKGVLTWAAEGVTGCGATSHGGLDDDASTRETVAAFLRGV